MSKYENSASEKILPPEGMHNARCIRFLELGTVETDFGDKFKCQFSFELVDESTTFDEEKGEQNFVVHRTFNRSLKPRSDMGKCVRALLGDEAVDEAEVVEMDDVLDQPCQVRIKYDDKKKPKYANIVEILPPPKGKISKSENDTQSLYLDENFDSDVFDSLPDWMQDNIKETDEGKALIEDGSIEDDKPKSKKGKKDDDDEDDEPKKKRGKKDEDEEEEEDEKPRRKKRPATRKKKR